jgi:hypothetical protein
MTPPLVSCEVKIAVAIARELAGFLWAALQPVATPAG